MGDILLIHMKQQQQNIIKKSWAFNNYHNSFLLFCPPFFRYVLYMYIQVRGLCDLIL